MERAPALARHYHRVEDVAQGENDQTHAEDDRDGPSEDHNGVAEAGEPALIWVWECNMIFTAPVLILSR